MKGTSLGFEVGFIFLATPKGHQVSSLTILTRNLIYTHQQQYIKNKLFHMSFGFLDIWARGLSLGDGLLGTGGSGFEGSGFKG